MPLNLSLQRPPDSPHDGESPAQQDYATQVHPNDALASESQPLQALAESRRLWILKNAPSDYQKIYSLVRDQLRLGIRVC